MRVLRRRVLEARLARLLDGVGIEMLVTQPASAKLGFVSDVVFTRYRFLLGHGEPLFFNRWPF